MSTAVCPSGSPTVAVSFRLSRLSLRKSQSPRYTLWREPMSERQINAYFERQILPGLSVSLEDLFHGLPNHDREEAVQDSVCQALEAYRMLKMHEYRNQKHRAEDIALTLASFTYRRYLAGARFAAPRSSSCL